MEEIKTKKKLSKKRLIICLILALVFGIVGFIDMKSNATESGKLLEVVTYYSNDTEYVNYSRTLNYTEDYELYWYAPSDTFYNGYFECFLYVVSKEHSGLGNDYDYGFVMNGETYYVTILHNSSTSFDGNGYIAPRINGKVVTKVDKGMYHAEFVQNYMAGNIKPDIDFDNLPIDDDMPFVSEIKRNYIINHYSSPGEEGITQPSDTYEYLIWSNSSDLPIQLEVVPVVQYYKTLFGKSDFLEEYIGEWRDFELLDSGTTKYLRQTDDASLLEKYNEDYQFKKACLSERSVNIFTETVYFFYGYRVRYVDIENEKAGAWTVVMPSQIVNESEKWQEYSDGFVSNSSNSSGEVSDTNYGDVDKNIEEIEETINFKDKYDVVDGNANTQEVMNWLNTVVSFIKGTPSIVTSVLSFLPQPILYGMYITIFLGCIASAIAIVKALI